MFPQVFKGGPLVIRRAEAPVVVRRVETPILKETATVVVKRAKAPSRNQVSRGSQ